MRGMWIVPVAALAFALPQSEGRVGALEGYVSLYGGWGTAGSGTVKGTARDNGLFFVGPEYPVNSPYVRSEHGTGGMRIGLWFDDDPWRWFGGALDVSYFGINSSSPDTSIGVAALSVLVMLRYPMMTSSDYPAGRTQPYVGLGLAAVSADLETQVTRPDNTTGTVSVGATGPGLDLHAGWSFKLTEHTGLFAEYRYLYAEVEGKTEDSSFVFFPDEIVRLKTTLSEQQVLGGFFISF